MKIFRLIWTDIKRGENIDLYLTIVVVFVLGILNIVGPTPSAWLTSATLAALGILSISALKNEHHFQEMMNKLTQSNQFFIDDFPVNLRNEIVDSTELLLIGVTLSRTIKTYYSDIESKLRRGHLIKVLLVHPEGAAVEMAETRIYGRANIIRTKADIRAVLDDLGELQKVAPDKMQIRTIQNPLTYGAIVINPESTNGVLFLEHYSYKTIGGSKPKFILRAGYNEWYSFFRDEVMILWNHGKDWKST